VTGLLGASQEPIRLPAEGTQIGGRLPDESGEIYFGHPTEYDQPVINRIGRTPSAVLDIGVLSDGATREQVKGVLEQRKGDWDAAQWLDWSGMLGTRVYFFGAEMLATQRVPYLYPGGEELRPAFIGLENMQDPYKLVKAELGQEGLGVVNRALGRVEASVSK
jgi:hypothetical protein